MESATTVANPQASGPGPAKGPAADARLRTLGATMKRHQYQPDALIEVLHTAQELYGYLDLELLVHIAQGLKPPPSRVYGVATFYHFFSLEPKGKHTCVMCMGTACYVKGAATLVKTIEDYARVRSGETRADGSMSLVQARCIGACGIADAVTAIRPLLDPRCPAADTVAGTSGERPATNTAAPPARAGGPRERRHANTQEEWGCPTR